MPITPAPGRLRQEDFPVPCQLLPQQMPVKAQGDLPPPPPAQNCDRESCSQLGQQRLKGEEGELKNHPRLSLGPCLPKVKGQPPNGMHGLGFEDLPSFLKDMSVWHHGGRGAVRSQGCRAEARGKGSQNTRGMAATGYEITHLHRLRGWDKVLFNLGCWDMVNR